MSDPAALLLRAVARALADDRRVLLADSSFETLAALAQMRVKELVLITPTADPRAPAGQTASGAPLRMRADWRERPHSKDLIIDPEGLAPADEVMRVLKKHGIYLTGVHNEALGRMAHTRPLQAHWTHALVSGEGSSVWPLADAEVEGPTIYLGTKTDPPPAPDVLCGVPAAWLPATQQTQALGQELAQAKLELLEAQDAIEAAQDAHEATADALEAQRDACDAAQVERLAAIEAVERLELRVAELEAALQSAKTEAAQSAGAATALLELEADYDQVRAELAERRVMDRRAEAQAARFDEATASMGQELAALKAQLREVALPAADVKSLREEREAARGAARRVTALASSVLKTLAPDHPFPAAPLAISDSKALQGWCAQAQAIADRVQLRAQDAVAACSTLRTNNATLVKQATELAEAVTVLRLEKIERGAPTPAPVPTPKAMELRGELRAMEASLRAERTLRLAQRAAFERRLSAADGILKSQEASRAQLAEARRTAAQARLGQSAREEAARRYQTELALRAARIDDLEALLEAHGEMHELLGGALEVAERRRDEAEAGRRLADENLRILRSELARGAGGV